MCLNHNLLPSLLVRVNLCVVSFHEYACRCHLVEPALAGVGGKSRGDWCVLSGGGKRTRKIGSLSKQLNCLEIFDAAGLQFPTPAEDGGLQL